MVQRSSLRRSSTADDTSFTRSWFRCGDVGPAGAGLTDSCDAAWSSCFVRQAIAGTFRVCAPPLVAMALPQPPRAAWDVARSEGLRLGLSDDQSSVVGALELRTERPLDHPTCDWLAASTTQRRGGGSSKRMWCGGWGGAHGSSLDLSDVCMCEVCSSLGSKSWLCA